MKKKKKLTAGESMLAGAKSALAFARGEKDHGCIVHIPEEIDVKRAQESKQKAEAALKTGKTEADFTHAEDALKRAETRLEVAEKKN